MSHSWLALCYHVTLRCVWRMAYRHLLMFLYTITMLMFMLKWRIRVASMLYPSFIFCIIISLTFIRILPVMFFPCHDLSSHVLELYPIPAPKNWSVVASNNPKVSVRNRFLRSLLFCVNFKKIPLNSVLIRMFAHSLLSTQLSPMALARTGSSVARICMPYQDHHKLHTYGIDKTAPHCHKYSHL